MNIIIADVSSITRFGLILVIKEIYPSVTCYEVDNLDELNHQLNINTFKFILVNSGILTDQNFLGFSASQDYDFKNRLILIKDEKAPKKLIELLSKNCRAVINLNQELDSFKTDLARTFSLE